MENLKEDIEGSSEDNCFKQLERVFINCFQKVDNEVAGATASTDSDSKEPIAPETVGSTAVVAILCSSHIIVSNCGDSRAVLCRGKEALALSVDHKVRLLMNVLCYLFIKPNICLVHCSQTEKMSVQGLKLMEEKLFSGMVTVS